MEKFALWFLCEITGTWFIWATYMAVKFMTEDAQGQRAAFSVLGGHNNVGAFIILPVIATIVWSLGSAVIIGSE